MSIVDYRTTHWMHHAHPETKPGTTAAVIDYHCKGHRIKSVQLYPDDLVVIAIGDGNQARLIKLYPARLLLYKHLWDNVNNEDQKLLRKHFKRCPNIREQVKTKLVTEAVLTWYMAIVLGSHND